MAAETQADEGAGFVARRGIHGWDTVDDALQELEQTSCSRGCIFAGGPAAVEAFGPSGICALVVRLVMEMPVPDFRLVGDGLHFDKRRVPPPIETLKIDEGWL